MRNQQNKHDRLTMILKDDKEKTPRRTKDDEPKFRRQKAVPRKITTVPYKFDASVSLPVPGEGVAVCHRSSIQPNGSVRLERTNVEHRTIKQVYLSDADGFSIRDHVGDTWYVRPASIGGSKWETFYPGEKQKVRK